MITFEISNSYYCTEADIVYSMAVTPISGLTNLISFSNSNRVVAWSTMNNLMADSYTITITGKLIAV
jgi:hypothetical protein